MKKAIVIVVGGGAAAFKAACAAADSGAHVEMITGGQFASTGSTYYPFSPAWGIMYADSDSDRDAFFNEIKASSLGCQKLSLSRMLVDKSEEIYQELVNIGLQFISLKDINLNTCFGATLRGAVLKDVSGLKPVFLRELMKRDITIQETLQAVDLLIHNNICCGLVCSKENGELVMLPADSVVLASGGAESLWEYCCAGEELMGSSYAIAAKHGATLINLEFIQFLLGTINPLPRTLFYHFTLNTEPVGTDFQGNPFFRDESESIDLNECLLLHSQHGPFTTMDSSMLIETNIIHNTIRDQKINGLRIQYTKNIDTFPEFSRWVRYLKGNNVDYQSQAFYLYPHCQGFNGGIEINEQAETKIPGVFACGESAGGIHGANRMGGNSILATQVFGKIAGEKAAAFAIQTKTNSNPFFPKYTFTSGQGNVTTKEALSALRTVMQRYAFIERNEDGLQSALRTLSDIEDGFDAAKQAFIEQNAMPYKVSNGIIAAKAILKSMLQRQETIGGHLRTDFPEIIKHGELNRLKMN